MAWVIVDRRTPPNAPEFWALVSTLVFRTQEEAERYKEASFNGNGYVVQQLTEAA